MTTNPHIVFLPGDVSVNAVEALKGAFSQLRPRSPLFSSAAIDQTKQRLNSGVKRVLGTPIYPRATKKYTNHIKSTQVEPAKDKIKRVKQELIEAGATFYGLLKAEGRFLPKVLHNDEHVEAVVYGQHRSSSVMLIATSERIIFLDKKPTALFLDEVSYEVVSGIEFAIHTLFASLVLHTPVKNYDIRFANLHCAQRFAKHIENERLTREKVEHQVEEVMEHELAQASTPKFRYPIVLKDHMAGYYWLPNEEDELSKLYANN